MTDMMTDIAKMRNDKPPTIPDRSAAVPNQENLPSTNPFDMLPASKKATVVRYLQFDDLVHEQKIKLDKSHIPDDIIFQFMQGTDFEEPIRYIFKDFERSMDGSMDYGRLEKLQALMKNVHFQSYLSFWESITEFTLSYDHRFYCYGQANIDRFVDLIKAKGNCPAKTFVLSKVGNDVELKRVLARGQWPPYDDGTCKATYVPTLPPIFIHVFGRIITKGDKESVALFEQLVSQPVLKKYFIHDLQRMAFKEKLVQVSQTGGQSRVLLHDDVIARLQCLDLRASQSEIVHAAISHDRLDILDGILKKFEKAGEDFHRLLESILFFILNKACFVTGYDFKLAKDLIARNIDAIRNAPEVDGETLAIKLLSDPFCRTPTLPMKSLILFMLEQYKESRVQIRAEDALEVAKIHGNDHDYKEYIMQTLSP